MNRAVIDDDHNYRIELTSVKRSLRRVFREAPDDLARSIQLYFKGKQVRTNLRTLWALTEVDGLKDRAVVKRLRRDLLWRFSHIIGVPLEDKWAPVHPFHLRDYYLNAYASGEYLHRKAMEEAEHDNYSCKAGASFEDKCKFAASGATSREMCALNLADTCRTVTSAMMDVATGSKKASDLRPAIAAEFALLKCALSIAEAAFVLTDDVDAQIDSMLMEMTKDLRQNTVPDYLVARSKDCP